MDQTSVSTSVEAAAAASPSGSGGNDEGGDEEEDPSSSSASSEQVARALNSFHNEWKREVQLSPRGGVGVGRGTAEFSSRSSTANLPLPDVEDEARRYYLCGMKAEQAGKLYEAIHYYKRAVQIVPDIEFRVTNMLPKVDHENSDDSDAEIEDNNNNPEMDNDLSARFCRFFVETKICQAQYEQRTTHISALPREVIIYIFKWVVSRELDMRSLEQLSLVCRGFYLCARDAELWRLTCASVWGSNCGLLNKYVTWRDMYIHRPHAKYNGLYISKTTYIRPGEASFQDVNYRPWYTVDYYRYVRFFPEGLLLMLTTPDDPLLSIAKLRYRSAKHPAVLIGHYQLHGSLLSAVLKRPKTSEPVPVIHRYRRHRTLPQAHDPGEQTFHVELEVNMYKNVLNCKLEWRRYAVRVLYRNGQETVTDFDLSPSKFPPFWFSCVKSYTAESDSPLQ